MKPVRLRLSRARGFNLQELSLATNGLEAINVARPGPYGNPFIIGRHGTRAYCVELFSRLFEGLLPIVDHETTEAARRIINDMPALLTAIHGKNCACWCGPGDPCHGDIWIEAAHQMKCEPVG